MQLQRLIILRGWFLFIAFVCFIAMNAAWGQQLDDRQILAINLLKINDTRFRAVIQMDEVSQPTILNPKPGVPLKIELSGTDFKAGLKAKPETNELIRNVMLFPSDIGMARIEFTLATHLVDVRWHLLRNESLLVITMILKPGAVILPDGALLTPTPTSLLTPRVKSTNALPTAPPVVDVGDMEPDHGDSSISHMAMPTPRSPLDRMALPTPDRKVTQVPTSSAVKRRADLKPFENYPIHLISGVMDFGDKRGSFKDAKTNAETMEQYYEDNFFLLAYQQGASTGLTAKQSKYSMNALLFLLAECHYQITKGFHNNTIDPAEKNGPEPDWDATLNHHQQAIRFAPNSPLVDFAKYRMSMIYGKMNDYNSYRSQFLVADNLENKLVILEDLFERDVLPEFDIDQEMAEVAFTLVYYHPDNESFLAKAEKGYQRFLDHNMEHPGRGQALFNYGEICYLQGEVLRKKSEAEPEKKELRLAYLKKMQDAVDNLFKGSNDGGVADDSREHLAHFALAKHRVGDFNLANPKNAAERTYVSYIIGGENRYPSQDIDLQMEYIRILEKAGMKPLPDYYFVTKFDESIYPEEVYESRLALIRYGLADARSGNIDPEMNYKDYANAYEAVIQMEAESFREAQKKELLEERAKHLVELGRNQETLELILEALDSKVFETDKSVGDVYIPLLRGAVWDIVPIYMNMSRDEHDDLYAVEIYESFKDFLPDYPILEKVNDVYLTVGGILVDNNLGEEAAKALIKVGPEDKLTMEQKKKFDLLRSELRLDPAKPEQLKTEALALLARDIDQDLRASLLKMLGKVYSAEENHTKAAQTYLEGTQLIDLPWQERLLFFALAGEEYEAALVYKRAYSVYWQGKTAIGEEGVSMRQAEAVATRFLMGMGDTASAMQDYFTASEAYAEYLSLYPKGEFVFPVRYDLAKSYEEDGKAQDALKQYDLLASEAEKDPLWGKMAAKMAELLRWKISNSAPQKEPMP